MGMSSLHVSESPKVLPGSRWRKLQGDLEHVRSLMFAKRQRVQTAHTGQGLKFPDIAAQADSLVDGQ